MTEAEDDIETWPEVLVWNVAFLSGPRTSWWDWLTPADYRHCAAYGWCQDRWITYDAADIRSRIMVMTDEQFDLWLYALRQRATLVIQVPTGDMAPLRARLGLWCVTALKHLTGSRSSALRPKALSRDLVRQGGKVVFDGREGKAPEGK